MKSNYPTGKWELIENPIALESKLAIVSKEEGEKPILICQVTSIRGDSYKDNIPYIPSISKLIVESGNVLIETGKTPLQLADENKDLLDVCQKLLLDFIYSLSNQGKVLGWSDEKISEQIEKHPLIISSRNAINKATNKMKNISIKDELNSLKEKGVKTVSLNGWTESIDYVITLHSYSLTRISEGDYQSNPK